MTQMLPGDASLHMFRGQSVLPFGPSHRQPSSNAFVGNDNMKIPHLGLLEDPVGISYGQQFHRGAVTTQFGVVSGFASRATNDLSIVNPLMSKSATSLALGEVALNRSGFGLTLTAGLMNEAGSFLGASTVGENTSGLSSFLSLATSYDMGRGLTLLASTTFGRSDGRMDSGDVGYVAQTKALSFGLMKKSLFARDDVMTVSWSQPNRIEKGQMALHTAVDVSMDTGAPIFGVIPVSMVPSGREQRFTMGWTAPVGKQSALGLTAMRRFDPNHNALAKPENALGLRFTRDF
jgi:hypothetical protein